MWSCLRWMNFHCRVSGSFRDRHSNLVTKRDKARVGIVRRKRGEHSQGRDHDRFADIVCAFEPFEHLVSFAASRINARNTAGAAFSCFFDELPQSGVGLFSLTPRRADERDGMSSDYSWWFEFCLAQGGIEVAFLESYHRQARMRTARCGLQLQRFAVGRLGFLQPSKSL